MAYYKGLRYYPDEKRIWICDRLLALRAHLDETGPPFRRAGSVIVGSWNLRAFDGGVPRLDESYHYIAEIISRFDVCAIQEIKGSLKPLEKLSGLLGPSWDFMVTDIPKGKGGNNERLAYIYDKRRVVFRNLVGELVFPSDSLIHGEQPARTPLFARFQAEWFRFTLCTAHISFDGRPAKDGHPAISGHELRKAEIDLVAGELGKRSKKEKEVYFFIGDMNIEKANDPIFDVLRGHGFTVPDFEGTNLERTKYYDQLAYTGEGKTTKFLQHGTIEWSPAVYRAEDSEHYRRTARDVHKKAYAETEAGWKRNRRTWITNEMSDHLPIWAEIKTDFSNDYLKRVKKGK